MKFKNNFYKSIYTICLYKKVILVFINVISMFSTVVVSFSKPRLSGSDPTDFFAILFYGMYLKSVVILCLMVLSLSVIVMFLKNNIIVTSMLFICLLFTVPLIGCGISEIIDACSNDVGYCRNWSLIL